MEAGMWDDDWRSPCGRRRVEEEALLLQEKETGEWLLALGPWMMMDWGLLPPERDSTKQERAWCASASQAGGIVINHLK